MKQKDLKGYSAVEMVIGTVRDNVSKTHFDFVNKYICENKSHRIHLEVSYGNIMRIWSKRSKVGLDPVVLKRADRLFADMYDESVHIIFEIQGQQHFTLIHKGGYNYAIRLNDRNKRSIAKEINAKLTELNLIERSSR